MLGEGLYALLAASADLQALLGTAAARSDHTTGIFPTMMPEATPLPAIVITQIAGGGPAASLDGANAFHTARMQFSCYGKSYGDAKKLAATLRRSFEGYKGTLADGTEVDNVLLLLEADTFEEAPFIYHSPMDVEILYRDVGN